MCVACQFKSFWDSKSNTCSDFPLRVLIGILRLCHRLPEATFSHSNIKHLFARLTPYILARSLIRDCSTWELIVLGGTVSRFLTVLPSEIIFQSSFRCSSTFRMKLTDFAICIVVLLA
jgi:hypothetical protein